MKTSIAIKFGLLVLMLGVTTQALAEEFEAAPPSTVRKVNITTGPIVAIKKMLFETTLKIKSEANQQEWVVILKRSSAIYQNDKKLKQFNFKTGMRVKAYHTNSKASDRQIVKKIEILD